MDSPNSHDIGPGEERMAVEVITGGSLDPGAEGEPVYERYFLNRPANSVFFEPFDEGSGVDAIRPESTNRRAEHQKYQVERERLKTFEGVWKSEYNVTKEDLAQDGFIYKGPGDLTMCVFCLKSIRKWDAGDSVSGEHRRLYPKCPWVLGKVHHLNEPISRKDNMKKDMRIIPKGMPQYSDMETFEAREQSFKGWVKRENVTVGNLVKHGFFYDNSNDTLACYHCGTKIHGWDIENDLLGHHARNSPDCPMIQSGKDTLSAVSADIALTEGQGNVNGADTSDKKEATASIDEDMQSSAVQAIVTSFGSDYSMEDIKRAVQALRISGETGPIHSDAILRKLDPDLDG